MSLITHRMVIERPGDVETAAQLLASHPETGRVLAGGQSLVPLMKLGLSQPEVLVDISDVRELDGVRETSDGLIEVGAMVRHYQVETDERIQQRLPILALIAHQVGDPQIRTLGTLGGVLAHADPAGDYCMLALMLEAAIVTNHRAIPAEDFLLGPFTTALQPGELVTAVRFPATSEAHAFVKIAEMPFDSGIPSVAVQRLGEGWRIGLTNFGHGHARARQVEEALDAGASADEASGNAWRATDEMSDEMAVPLSYRLDMARVLTRRALTSAIGLEDLG